MTGAADSRSLAPQTGSVDLREFRNEGLWVEPDMKILADVDETHDAFPVYDNRRRVGHSLFDRLCCVVPDPKASN